MLFGRLFTSVLVIAGFGLSVAKPIDAASVREALKRDIHARGGKPLKPVDLVALLSKLKREMFVIADDMTDAVNAGPLTQAVVQPIVDNVAAVLNRTSAAAQSGAPARCIPPEALDLLGFYFDSLGLIFGPILAEPSLVPTFLVPNHFLTVNWIHSLEHAMPGIDHLLQPLLDIMHQLSKAINGIP